VVELRGPGPGAARLNVDGSVELEVLDRVAVVTLNRPAARNAFDPSMARSFAAAIDAVEAGGEVSVAVLCANTDGQERPVFSAGADLKTVAAGRAGELIVHDGGFAGFVERERVKPVIAAVDGLAVGGGLELVLACDLVVASRRASFALAEVRRGLIAGAGGLHRLTRAIGRAAAMDAILTGEPIDAERAYALGLVSRLAVPGGALEEALLVAQLVRSAAPLAVRASRRVVLAATRQRERELVDMTTAEFAAIAGSDDVREGVAAFVARRAPVWQAR
jgi:enoyl-CoA hydratase